MRKIFLASVAVLAFAGVAQARDDYRGNRPTGNSTISNTGTVSGNFDYTKTRSQTNIYTQSHEFNQYNGFQGFTSAEHGGGVETKSNGHGVAAGASLNYSKANFAGAEVNVNGQIGGGINAGPLTGNGSIAGNLGVRGLTASSESASGSLAVAASAGGGSSSVVAGGYAAGGAGARNESGYGNTYQQSHNYTDSTRWQGSGSYTRAQ